MRIKKADTVEVKVYWDSIKSTDALEDLFLHAYEGIVKMGYGEFGKFLKIPVRTYDLNCVIRLMQSSKLSYEIKK